MKNQPPAACSSPILSRLSPNNKPALSQQRDHSACRRPETPLKVRKTRENLKQSSVYADIPPPCVHLASHSGDHDGCAMKSNTAVSSKSSSVFSSLQSASNDGCGHATAATDTAMPASSAHGPVASKMQRQKSVSRRMLSRVKQGIAGRPRSSVRPAESETSLIRRLSGRGRQSFEAERRSHSFDISSESIASSLPDTLESDACVTPSAQRSVSDSTVSTAEVLGDSPTAATLRGQQGPIEAPASLKLSRNQSPLPSCGSSPSPQATPRPPREFVPSLAQEFTRDIATVVPCVDLDVAIDCPAVDAQSKRDVWVSMQATVRARYVNIRLRTHNAGLSD